MLTILSNILFTGFVLGVLICLVIVGILTGRLDMSALLLVAGSIMSYLIAMHMNTLAKNIEASMPDEEEQPPHV